MNKLKATNIQHKTWIYPRVTNRKHSIWMNREATVYQYLLDNVPHIGLRINVMEWDDGETEIRLIKGDGRTSNFEEFKKSIIQGHSQKEIHSIANEFLKFAQENNLTNINFESVK